MMTFKEMSNEQLIRHYIFSKRELKHIQSVIKEEEEELNKRFDNQTLVEEESE